VKNDFILILITLRHWNARLTHCSLTNLVVLSGPPSEEHCYADIDAAYDYLRKDLNIPAQNIVLYGRSLGSGPSCYLATKTALLEKKDAEYAAGDGPVGGLILHAPFLSVYRVVVDTGCTLYGDKFPNVDIISMVRSPTLMVHGTSDQIVPFHHSERLYEAISPQYRARPLYIEGMSHNNVHAQVRRMFIDKLTVYLEEHVWPGAVIRGANTRQAATARDRIWNIVDSEKRREQGQTQDMREALPMR
jgi:fermentation-respiration switch protein FrsA (DUF1100 family)